MYISRYTAPSHNFLIFLCSEESIAFWVKWSDFYMWPHITQFDSFDHLTQLLDDADFAAISKQVESENAKIKEETVTTWEANFDRMFNGVEPGHYSGGAQKSWEDSMEQAVPGLKVGRCGKGDDNFSNVDWSSVVM
jgi:hypothetical protein